MSEGLVHAFLIGESGKPRTLDWNGIRAWKPELGLMWVHLDASFEESRQWVSTGSYLPSIVPNALLADETRPRVNAVGDGALVVLRGVNLNPGADPEDMVSIRLWVESQRVISVRLRRMLSVEDVVASLEQQPLTGAGDLVVRLAGRLVDRMSDVIDGMEERVADLEQSVLHESEQSMRFNLTDLRREAITLRRYLAPQREALGRLQSEQLSWFTELDRLRLREVYDRLIRHVEDLDAVRERAAVVQEELISHLSNQINQRMYVLSVVAAVFLPLGFLTGLLGVNVGGIPGAESPYGFVAFILILVLLVVLQAWYFIKKRWF